MAIPGNSAGINPGKDRENQIIELVRQIVQSSSLSLYADLWAKAGFTITRSYTPTEYAPASLLFSSTRSYDQVANFHISENWSEEAAAWRLVDLIMPLLTTKQYQAHFDLWAKAGFHITPVPADPVENRQFKPNFFLLGAAKCGTTTLHRYLGEIPAVCMSLPKEPFFFEAEYELGLEHYRRKYFKHWNGEYIIGDARHRNLYLPFVAQSIWNVNPQAKLVVCIRNPIERAYSHWWHWYSRKIESLGFEQAVQEDIERIQANWRTETPHEIAVYKEVLDSTGKGIYRSYIDSGYYYRQICRYLDYFPNDQIKIILFDDLQQRPYFVIKELESFIGTDYYGQDNFLTKKENPHSPESNDFKRMPISPKFRTFLNDHYQEHNVKLAHLINKDLSHWQ
jgi:hypothetical protein